VALLELAHFDDVIRMCQCGRKSPVEVTNYESNILVLAAARGILLSTHPVEALSDNTTFLIFTPACT